MAIVDWIQSIVYDAFGNAGEVEDAVAVDKAVYSISELGWKSEEET